MEKTTDSSGFSLGDIHLDPLSLIISIGGFAYIAIKYIVRLRDKETLMTMDKKIVENNKVLKAEIHKDMDTMLTCKLSKIELATHGKVEESQAVLMQLLEVVESLKKKKK